MLEAGAGTATILYTDIVGSTEMRARLGDADADRIRRRHDEILGSAVAKHGGSVVKGLGDGILAAFGATAEAVNAADEIQRSIDSANRQARDDHRIGVRVGISAGDVSWEDGDCHGTPVVTATRLCDAADGGQILCDDLVRGLARGRTELRFVLIGEIELKGLPDPVIAFEVPWTAAINTAAPLPAPLRRQAGELPFAARENERLRLTDAWKRAEIDRATTVLLAGEPGIGKTRLASEVARQAHDEGALVVLGRCDEHIAAPHAPWSELLRSVVTSVSDDIIVEHVAHHGGELMRLVPDLARRAPDAPPPASADPDTERLLVFEAVVDILQRSAEAQPLVVLVDDADWADSGSVNLLRHVVSHVDPDSHILVLVTYRDTDIDRSHPLAGALADLYRAAGAERIALHGLDETGMRVFLEAVGGTPLEAEGIALAQRLAAETDGNPFFVTEVLRHLVETGALVQIDGVWVGTVVSGEAGLPEGVRDVVGQRLSRLSSEANDLLRTAAVFGREFDVSLVAAVMQVDEDTAVDRLDEAVDRQLVDEVEGSAGRLSFAHALVRQTLLEELSTNKRVRLHRKIAELLDARTGTSVEVLAHHYLEAAVAGVAPRAIECAREAARGALERMAWEDAARLYERALEVVDILEDDDPGLRADILSLMATALHVGGLADAAHERALLAAGLARGAGDAARLAEAGMAYQGQLGMWASPDDPVGAEIMREGLAGLGTTRPDVRARALSALAHGQILAPGASPLPEADAGVAAARETGDDRALCYALLVRSWAVRGVLPVDERLLASEEGLAIANRLADTTAISSIEYLHGNVLLNRGDLEGARSAFLQTEFRGALEGWAIADFRAAVAQAEGRLEEADVLCDIAHDLGTALGETNEGVRALQHWGTARFAGNLDAATRWSQESIATAIGFAFPIAALNALSVGAEVDAREQFGLWMRDIEPIVPTMIRYSAIHYVSILAFEADIRDGLDGPADYADTFPGELLGADGGILGAATRRAGVSPRCGVTSIERLNFSSPATRCTNGWVCTRSLSRAASTSGSCYSVGISPVIASRAFEMLTAIADLANRIGMAPREKQARALIA